MDILSKGVGGLSCVSLRAMQQTQTVRLFHSFESSSSWRVRIALSLKKIAYVSIIVGLESGEHRQDSYRQVNPIGQVPTLEVDGRHVSQSMASSNIWTRHVGNHDYYPTMKSYVRLPAKLLKPLTRESNRFIMVSLIEVSVIISTSPAIRFRNGKNIGSNDALRVLRKN